MSHHLSHHTENHVLSYAVTFVSMHLSFESHIRYELRHPESRVTSCPSTFLWSQARVCYTKINEITQYWHCELQVTCWMDYMHQNMHHDPVSVCLLWFGGGKLSSYISELLHSQWENHIDIMVKLNQIFKNKWQKCIFNHILTNVDMLWIKSSETNAKTISIRKKQ